mmetsp:Transcript_35786/g.89340  ORF Transcript_35786/g.89340 Transcript_35786/m.89340 type:complete len:338 (-) Transcript_35786:108-1121(-)
MLGGRSSHGSGRGCLRCPDRVCAGGWSAVRWFCTRGDHRLLAGGDAFAVVQLLVTCTSSVGDIVEPGRRAAQTSDCGVVHESRVLLRFKDPKICFLPVLADLCPPSLSRLVPGDTYECRGWNLARRESAVLDVVPVGARRVLLLVVVPDVNVLPLSFAACRPFVFTPIPGDAFEPRGKISVAPSNYLHLFLVLVVLLLLVDILLLLLLLVGYVVLEVGVVRLVVLGVVVSPALLALHPQLRGADFFQRGLRVARLQLSPERLFGVLLGLLLGCRLGGLGLVELVPLRVGLVGHVVARRDELHQPIEKVRVVPHAVLQAHGHGGPAVRGEACAPEGDL